MLILMNVDTEDVNHLLDEVYVSHCVILHLPTVGCDPNVQAANKTLHSELHYYYPIHD